MYGIFYNVKKVYLVTEKTRDHLTPELKLALVTPKTPAYKLSQEQFPFKDPYWYVLFKTFIISDSSMYKKLN